VDKRHVFLASKTIGVLLIPSNFISLFGVVGLILFRTRYASVGRTLVCACVAAYVICGFSPLGNLLLVPLETRFPPWNAGKGEPDGMIVLGGAIDPDLSAARGAAAFGNAADRILAAAALAHRYPSARIVYAGGNANAFQNDEAKEADYASSYLKVWESRATACRSRGSPETLRKMLNSLKRWLRQNPASDGSC